MIIVPIWAAVVCNIASVGIIFLVLPESLLIGYIALMVALLISLVGYAMNGYYAVAGLHLVLILAASLLMFRFMSALRKVDIDPNK